MAEHEQGRQGIEPGQEPKPATDATDAQLSDEQLDQVAGGWSWGETMGGTH